MVEKKAEHVRIAAGFLRRYCGNDPVEAEQSLLEWEAYAKKPLPDRTIPGVQDAELASVYARLYSVNKHMGKSEAAEAYLQKAIAHQQQAATAAHSSPTSRELVRVWADSQLDWNFDVKWKTQNP